MGNVVEHRACVFKRGSCTCMARIVGENGVAITRAAIASIAYTVGLIDPDDEDADAGVEGHVSNALSVPVVVFDAMQHGTPWTVDEIGYNFRHVVDVSEHVAFAIRGREYRIVYELTPTSGQVIVVDFRVKAV